MDVDPSAVADARCVSFQADGWPFGCVPRLRVGLVFPEENVLVQLQNLRVVLTLIPAKRLRQLKQESDA